MNVQVTVDQLRKLKLSGMAKAYEAVLTAPIQEQLTADLLIGRLAEAELQYRVNQKTELYLHQSKLRYHAHIEQIYCNAARNLTKDQLLTLADGRYLEQAANILITGATGCGKSFLACALGRQACALGYRVLYFGMNRFLERITQSKLDGTYIKLLNQIEKTHLVILDDFGLHPMDGVTRLAMLQVLEDRYGKKSMIVTSQLPVVKWFEFLKEPTQADAILDRLAGNAHRVELEGDTLRKRKVG